MLYVYTHTGAFKEEIEGDWSCYDLLELREPWAGGFYFAV